MIKLEKRLGVALATVGLTAGLNLAMAVPAGAAEQTAPTADFAILSAWHYNYYDDYFYSFETCDARGYKMKYVEHVTGMLNWHCHKDSGETKWSMDVLWST